ncbi:FecR family protein [Pedobacter caeni]|uniref:FecR family protein n=1 Tax=Pedobacter caeni TaxID=288992 RepID=A0A1M4VYX0_9SPHI|nr:FecR family protein [Pedobacter caeni]SHE74063.1 FecR family protein [Pedobacter caeni]
MMSNTRLFYLFQLQLKHQASEAEKAELMNLLGDPENEEEAKELLGEAWKDFEPSTAVFTPVKSKQLLENIFQAGRTEEELPVHQPKRWLAIVAAAAVLLLISAVALFYYSNYSDQENLAGQPAEMAGTTAIHDVEPGGNKAVLTLADGTRIALDEVSNGKIANQSGISITKAADGQLSYTIKEGQDQQNETSQINTISTPKGGKYQINLPDGSKVWLNAASSLKFPTRFSEEERKVELKGEAYFEISKQHSRSGRQPFKVITLADNGRSQEVEVLGTHFNINAYGNENAMRTTLLEGSVRVTNLSSKASGLLTPGQQAILKNDRIKIATADLEEVMAWKKGNFLFNNLKLTDIMKQLERWYNVEVDYAHIPDTRYHGFISKDVTLSQVLDMLELTGSLKFKIEPAPDGKGKKIEIE